MLLSFKSDLFITAAVVELYTKTQWGKLITMRLLYTRNYTKPN